MRESAAGQVLLPFELVEEVEGVVALAEHEPALAFGALLDALLDEGAVGRDAGAGADHYDRPRAVLGQAEVPVRLDVDAHLVADAAAVGEVRGGNAPALAAVQLPAHGADQEVSLARMRVGARSDRVKPPGKRPQKAE